VWVSITTTNDEGKRRNESHHQLIKKTFRNDVGAGPMEELLKDCSKGGVALKGKL